MNKLRGPDEAICRMILEHLPKTAVALFDLDLVYTFVCGEGLAETGRVGSTIVGKRVGETSQTGGEVFVEHCAKVLDSGGEVHLASVTALDRIYDVDFVAIHRDGEVIGGLMVTRDVTHRAKNAQHIVGLTREVLAIKLETLAAELRKKNQEPTK